MSTIKFVETHNLVAFLKKLAKTEGFKQIVDFLNANPIRCTLIVNPTIYTSCIQQFWDSAKVKAVNEDVHIRALIDGKKIIVIKASIRCDLQLQDVEGTACLPNDTIFKELARIGGGKGYSGIITPLFETMMVQALEEVGEESFEDKESLGDQEDASKHGRMIDQDEEIALVDETQGRMNEEEMFRVNDLDGDEVIIDVTAGENVEQSTKVTENETLIKIKAAKPKARGVIVQEPSEFRTTSSSKLPQAKDKGKGIMVEPEKPLKKKVQIAFDEEVARKLKAEIKAEMEEEERIAREKNEANMASLKKKSFDEIQKLFNSAMKRENTFVDMNTEIVEERSKKTQAEVIEGSSKRAGDELEQESAKKQKLEKKDDSAELKRCLKIVPEDDDDVTIQATPLYSKSLTIVDYKIYKEGKKSYFKIIRADGNSQSYLTFGKMFKNFNCSVLDLDW
nr:hypothetical protein [Tanacetum cinerariifolium]